MRNFLLNVTTGAVAASVVWLAIGPAWVWCINDLAGALLTAIEG